MRLRHDRQGAVLLCGWPCQCSQFDSRCGVKAYRACRSKPQACCYCSPETETSICPQAAPGQELGLWMMMMMGTKRRRTLLVPWRICMPSALQQLRCARSSSCEVPAVHIVDSRLRLALHHPTCQTAQGIGQGSDPCPAMTLLGLSTLPQCNALNVRQPQHARALGSCHSQASTSGRLNVVARASAPAQTAKQGSGAARGTTKQTAKGSTVAGRKTQSSSSTSGSRRGVAEDDPDRPRGSQYYFNVTGFPFPLGPVFQRSTLRREVRQRPNGR